MPRTCGYPPCNKLSLGWYQYSCNPHYHNACFLDSLTIWFAKCLFISSEWPVGWHKCCFFSLFFTIHPDLFSRLFILGVQCKPLFTMMQSSSFPLDRYVSFQKIIMNNEFYLSLKCAYLQWVPGHPYNWTKWIYITVICCHLVGHREHAFCVCVSVPDLWNSIPLRYIWYLPFRCSINFWRPDSVPSLGFRYLWGPVEFF